MGKFVIQQRPDGEYQFTLKANNNQTLLVSQGYRRKPAVFKGIASVKKNAGLERRFELRAQGKKHYFVLKSANGIVIGTSDMYETAIRCEKARASVKPNLTGVKIDDQAK